MLSIEAEQARIDQLTQEKIAILDIAGQLRFAGGRKTKTS
jgi:hypothetical protein